MMVDNADFVIENFLHRETYNPQSGTAKSFLVSKVDQEVRIPEIEKTVDFKQGEKIFTEIPEEVWLRKRLNL